MLADDEDKPGGFAGASAREGTPNPHAPQRNDGRGRGKRAIWERVAADPAPSKTRKMELIGVVTFVLLSAAPPDTDFVTMQFREIDGATQHLYAATCARERGKPSLCSLKVMSVRTDASALPCTATSDVLFENEVAQNPQPDTFLVTVSGGICGYSNTYVMSATGLVQTKTSPATQPPRLEKICQTFSPKTFIAKVSSDDSGGIFAAVPIGTCKALSIKL